MGPIIVVNLGELFESFLLLEEVERSGLDTLDVNA